MPKFTILDLAYVACDMYVTPIIMIGGDMDETRISQRLLQEQYASRVRCLCQNTSNIVLTNHAEDSMWERHINFDLVLKALRSGQITYQKLDKNGNPELQASIFVRSRSMSVICALVQHKGRIIVITAMWDDTR